MIRPGGILLGSVVCLALFFVLATPASAKPDGWQELKTSHDFATLVGRVETAVKTNEMFVVTRASASKGAAGRGVTIPGNIVMGVYRNDFAVRMLEASIPAGIEAPIRFYVTENADGTASLAYRAPSAVFAPYPDGGEALTALAAELDVVFAAIFEDATAQ